MNVFQTHAQIVDDYATYIHGFLKAKFRRVIADFPPELEANAANWYSNLWDFVSVVQSVLHEV
ncbi:MAG: hypothetical protein IPK16_00275 [Anaerolineales bacterium]|nr:hypothetical protein [Anaerolineales bacterium]